MEYKKAISDKGLMKKYYQKNHKSKKRNISKRPLRYKDYIISKYWTQQRNYNIEFFGGKCALCNRKAQTSHHRSYKFKDDRENKDLVALCWQCHTLFHDNYEYHSDGYFLKK
jgi:5-methylcytosine-specific restriction endonuclease McrA